MNSSLKPILCLIPILIIAFSFFAQTGYWTRIIGSIARKQKDPRKFLERMKVLTLVNLRQYEKLMTTFGYLKEEKPAGAVLPPTLTEEQLGRARLAAMKIVNLPYAQRLKAVAEAFALITALKLEIDSLRTEAEVGDAE